MYHGATYPVAWLGFRPTRVRQPPGHHIIHSQVLFTREQIDAKVAEMGARVAMDYTDKRPVFCPILKVHGSLRVA